MKHMAVLPPPAFALVHEAAEVTASTGTVSKKIYIENAMCNLSTMLCRPVPTHSLTGSFSPAVGPILQLDPHMRPYPPSTSTLA